MFMLLFSCRIKRKRVCPMSRQQLLDNGRADDEGATHDDLLAIYRRDFTIITIHPTASGSNEGSICTTDMRAGWSQAKYELTVTTTKIAVVVCYPIKVIFVWG